MNFNQWNDFTRSLLLPQRDCSKVPYRFEEEMTISAENDRNLFDWFSKKKFLFSLWHPGIAPQNWFDWISVEGKLLFHSYIQLEENSKIVRIIWIIHCLTPNAYWNNSQTFGTNRTILVFHFSISTDAENSILWIFERILCSNETTNIWEWLCDISFAFDELIWCCIGNLKRFAMAKTSI